MRVNRTVYLFASWVLFLGCDSDSKPGGQIVLEGPNLKEQDLDDIAKDSESNSEVTDSVEPSTSDSDIGTFTEINSSDSTDVTTEPDTVADADTGTDTGTDTGKESDTDMDASVFPDASSIPETDTESSADTDTNTDTTTATGPDTETETETETATYLEPDLVYQELTDTYWVRCPIGQTWNASTQTCRGTATKMTYAEAMMDDYENTVCAKLYGPDYLLPELYQVLDTLDCSDREASWVGYHVFEWECPRCALRLSCLTFLGAISEPFWAYDYFDYNGTAVYPNSGLVTQYWDHLDEELSVRCTKRNDDYYEYY